MSSSVFDLNQQNEVISSKIVASLERVSQAFKVLLWNESKAHGLSPIQIQILIFLHTHTQEKRKVSYLADEFNVSKATISETIKTLEQKKLILKANQKEDFRSYVIFLTPKGKEIAEKTAMFATEIETPINQLSLLDQEKLLSNLFSVIQHLNKAGIITLQRMCFSCQYYKFNDKNQQHFCGLLNTNLENSALRLDCEEHQFKQNVS